jgi:hypothetical protein
MYKTKSHLVQNVTNAEVKNLGIGKMPGYFVSDK